MSSAGHVYIWHTQTYDRSICNLNMLQSQLGKMLEDGSRAFTTKDPGIAPYRGTIKCRLHVDDVERVRWNSMGFATCPADHMPNSQQLLTHMQHRHPSEWATIEKERVDAQLEEDRTLNRAILNRLSNVAVAVPVAAVAPIIESEAVVDVPTEMPEASLRDTGKRVYATCPACQFTTWGDTELKAKENFKAHWESSHANQGGE
jgi:hypothetical protein